MNQKNSKQIDYLFEDPPVPNQKFALISIVGPHMPQQCDVWGLKVRGTAESAEKAKSMAQKIMRTDNTYDVYTVEVGKFFPLAVEPDAIGNIEYQNNQLNELVKTYMENKELANEHWTQRKNEMIKEAIREGKSQDIKPEHPVSVLQRIQHFEESVNKTKEDLSALESDLQLSKAKFASYTDEERNLANKELQSAIESNLEVNVPADNELSLTEIRDKLMEELNPSVPLDAAASNTQGVTVNKVISELKEREEELAELNELKLSMDQSKSPNVYNRLMTNITECQDAIQNLKSQLTNTNVVNEYINASYSNSQYDYLQSQPSSSS